MHGGATQSSVYLEEVHTLDVSGSTATWTLLSNAGDVPPGRTSFSMAAFGDGTLVTFGGFVDGCGACDDMYTFTVTGTVATWSQKTTAGDVPSGRYGHAMAVLADDTPVMFGGIADTGGFINDVYTFTLSGSTATWTSLSSQGDVVPSVRLWHTLTALSDGSAVTCSSDFLGDLYELQISGTNATWTELPPECAGLSHHGGPC